jgi:hypothetical protein
MGCRNLSFGLVNKARGFQGCGPRGKLRSHISCSWECQRVRRNEPSHSQVNSMLGIGVPMDSRIFKAQLQGSNPIGSKSYLYHWKSIEI